MIASTVAVETETTVKEGLWGLTQSVGESKDGSKRIRGGGPAR